LDEHYEWNEFTKEWTERARLTFPRGHAGESTRAIGCGFIIIAGSANDFKVLTDISYYDIDGDYWIKIGDVPKWVRNNVIFLCGVCC